jgi:hypothetical protein
MRLLLKLAWIPILVGLCGAAVGAGLASSGAAPTNPSFAIVQFPKSECTPPKVIIGKACVDKGGTILSGNWKFGDGSARWAPPGFTTTYAWSMPASIPPSGGAIKLQLTAEQKQGGSVCPAMGVHSGFPLKEAGQNTQLGVCAEQGKTASASKTLTVVPLSGGPAYILIGLQDGPQFTYKYDVAKKKGCRRTSGSAGSTASPSAGERAAAIEPPFTVSFGIGHTGVPPKGESPTLEKSGTRGNGELLICDKLEAKGALASAASGKIAHSDLHALPGLDRTEVLELTVKRGAYGADARSQKIALVVEVSKSNDRECPVGSQGRLTLTRDLDDLGVSNENEIWLRICGTSHTHRFKNDHAHHVVVHVVILLRE